MVKSKVVIAGAGCAGLAAGIALQKRGFEVTILEKSDRVGGLAGGIPIGSNTYEYGPHIFHTTDPEILSDVKRIAGPVLMPFEKTIKIKFMGKYFDFPLSIPDVMLKLPKVTVLRAVLSFFKHIVVGTLQGERALTNSEKVLQKLYGDVLYRLFFKDYIFKVWGIEPSSMAPSFAKQRIPRFDIIDFFSKIKKRLFGQPVAQVSTTDYVERVEGEHYTTKKGFALIAEAFAEEFKRVGGTIKLQTEVDEVHLVKGKCVAIGFQASGEGRGTLPCDQFVSTLPICLLPSLIQPALSASVLQTAQRLHFRGIVFVGILVRKPKVLPASFMYFRDKSFNRITDLGQFKVEIQPQGSTILIAEITCQPEDPYWTDEGKTQQTVIQELVDEKLIERDEILETHVFKTEHGYPIYSVGYESALQATLKDLEKIPNLHTIGRQGKFAYINTHVAMKMGYEAARKIERAAETVYAKAMAEPSTVSVDGMPGSQTFLNPAIPAQVGTKKEDC